MTISTIFKTKCRFRSCRGVTLFSGLAAGRRDLRCYLHREPRGARIMVIRVLVENVRLELTEGCLQSIPAPLCIPRILVPPEGIEPSTPAPSTQRSTN